MNIKIKKLFRFVPRSISVSLEDVLVWGVCALAILFVLLFLFDGYFFYRTALQNDLGVSATIREEMLTAKQIDEAIVVLDAREKIFNRLLTGE